MTHPASAAPPMSERLRLLIEAVEDYGIFMLDTLGHIVTWNLGAERLFGYTAQQAIGQHFSLFYPEDDRTAGRPQVQLDWARTHTKYIEEGWRTGQDGRRFWATVVLTALFDPQGQLTGFGNVTRDLSERRQHMEALRHSEETQRLLMESVRDYAIYMLSPEGIVQSWNHGAQLMKGYRAREVIGQHYRLFFRSEDIAQGLPERALQTALAQGRMETEGWRLRKDGSAFWSHVIVTPIQSEGRLMGFAKISRDMSERQRLRDLEHSSHRMHEFLSMLAHELRNPLAPIRNAVSILQLEPSPTPTIKTIRDMIDRQLSHMTRLVDDLLDAGRLTSGKIHIKPELVCFNHVLALASEAVRPDMDARGHQFDLQLPPNPIWVKADALRLTQVLQNLLGNATKFTPHGGRIHLRAHVHRGHLQVHIRDNGVGMSPEAMAHIFELFAQGDGFASSQSGLGIGLSLARSLVEMHGGSIHAHSDGPNRGSVFRFELPGATLRQPRNAQHPDDASPDAPTILVVDDNRDGADSLADILRSLGYHVHTAYDGRSALELLHVHSPHTVFLDIRLPDVDGPTVLQSIRRSTHTAPVFVCAISGYNRQEASEPTLGLDRFDAYLQKPVELDALRKVLQQSQQSAPSDPVRSP